MRIKNTIRNSLYSIISYAVLGILVLGVRKVFVINLPIDFLGLEGLFGNIFALLAMADLGIETVVLYRLMPAFANDDKKEICKLFSIYKYIYKLIGLAILVLGIILMPALRHFVKTDFTDWNYIYLVYFLQLIIVVCTYWLGYARIIFFVSQTDYKCIKLDTIVSFFTNIARIVVLMSFKSYLLYLLCNIVQNIISNWLISRKAILEYDYLDNIQNISWKDIKNMNLDKDMKFNLVQKTCGTIYGGTDNILIAFICGVKYVAIYSNYVLLIGFLTTLLVKLLRPFQSSIGNFIYSESEVRGYSLFRMFDMLSYFIASLICLSFYNCINPFLEYWLGKEFIFPSCIVFAIMLNQYVMWNHQFLTFYRYSFGNYELDKNHLMMGAVLNVLFSILGSHYLGFVGIIYGTVIGHIGIWLGRVRVVYECYIKEDIKAYYSRQVIRLIIFMFMLYFSCLLSEYTSNDLLGLFERIILCSIISASGCLFIIYNRLEYKIMKDYIKKCLKYV